MACKVIDWAIQAFGGGGTSNDFGLAAAYANSASTLAGMTAALCSPGSLRSATLLWAPSRVEGAARNESPGRCLMPRELRSTANERPRHRARDRDGTAADLT